MSDADSRGQQVDPREDLYRALCVREWWDFNVSPPRVSPFAFKVHSPFSVNVASLIGLDGAIRHLREVLGSSQGGIASFNCGQARSFGFDARHEVDPAHPDNEAHANVYYEGSGKTRKRAARSLADACTIVFSPSFQT